MKRHLASLFLLAVASFAILQQATKAQSLVDARDSSGAAVLPTSSTLPDLTYTPPTQKTKLRNYAFDAFGPYPIVGAALVAGINQGENTPPEWKQGAAGYGKRFASDFGIAAVSTTTRYALAEVFKEDTLYYRCECNGLRPRLRHAVISTFTARRAAQTAIACFLSQLWSLHMQASDRRVCVGIQAATNPRTGCEWATTPCWDLWAETSPWSSSIADHIHCDLACTSIMGMERHLQAQIHDRLQSKAVAGMQPPLPGPCNQLL